MSLLISLYFYPFRTVFILELKPRSSDDDMVSNEIARRTSFIRQIANLWLLQPHSPFAFLLPAKHLCHFLIGFRISGVVRRAVAVQQSQRIAE